MISLRSKWARHDRNALSDEQENTQLDTISNKQNPLLPTDAKHTSGIQEQAFHPVTSCSSTDVNVCDHSHAANMQQTHVSPDGPSAQSSPITNTKSSQDTIDKQRKHTNDIAVCTSLQHGRQLYRQCLDSVVLPSIVVQTFLKAISQDICTPDTSEYAKNIHSQIEDECVPFDTLENDNEETDNAWVSATAAARIAMLSFRTAVPSSTNGHDDASTKGTSQESTQKSTSATISDRMHRKEKLMGDAKDATSASEGTLANALDQAIARTKRYHSTLMSYIQRVVSSSNWTSCTWAQNLSLQLPTARCKAAQRRIVYGDALFFQSLYSKFESIDTDFKDLHSENLLRMLRIFLDAARKADQLHIRSLQILVRHRHIGQAIAYAATLIPLQMILVDYLVQSNDTVNLAMELAQEFELARRFGVPEFLFYTLKAEDMGKPNHHQPTFIRYSPLWIEHEFQIPMRENLCANESISGYLASSIVTTGILRQLFKAPLRWHWDFASSETDQQNSALHYATRRSQSFQSNPNQALQPIRSKLLNVSCVFFDSLADALSSCASVVYLNQHLPIPNGALPIFNVATMADINALGSVFAQITSESMGHYGTNDPSIVTGIDVEWRPQKMYDDIMPSYGAQHIARDDEFHDANKWTLHSSCTDSDYTALAERIQHGYIEYRTSCNLPENGSTQTKPDTKPDTLDWPASLLQISTSQAIYLIDMLAIYLLIQRQPGTRNTIISVLSDQIFKNPKLLKVGHGVEQDMFKLCTSFPYLVEAFIDCSPVVELQEASYGTQNNKKPNASHLYETDKTTADSALSETSVKSAQSTQSKSLSSMVYAAFGVELDKTCQISDWQIRPLGTHQRQYAAIDAYIGSVLAMFYANKMKSEIQQEQKNDTLNVLSEAQLVQQLKPYYKHYSFDSTHAETLAWERFMRFNSTTLSRQDSLLCLITPVLDTSALMKCVSNVLRVKNTISNVLCKHKNQLKQEVHFWQNVRVAEHVEAVSAADSAVGLHVEPARILKTIALCCKDQKVLSDLNCAHHSSIPRGMLVLAVVPGDRKVSLSALATTIRVSRRKLRVASYKECTTYFGFEPGEFPPFFCVSKTDKNTHSPIAKNDTSCKSTTSSEFHRTEFHRIVILDSSLASSNEIQSEACWYFGGGGSLSHMTILDHDELFSLSNLNNDVCCTRYADISAEMSKSDNRPSTSGKQSAAPSQNVSQVCSNQDSQGRLSTQELNQLFMPPRLLVDSMLGRLVRWLRVVGVDTEIIERSGNDRKTRALYDRLKQSGRIFITRDKKLLNRKDTPAAFYVSANDTHTQFKQVTEHFGITCSPKDLMSRCAKCNGKGYVRLDREQVERLYPGEVHEKVIKLVDEYWRCPKCGKLYWEGPKFYDTREKFESIMQRRD